jgi:uncharacterized protein (TIGR02001 family)
MNKSLITLTLVGVFAVPAFAEDAAAPAPEAKPFTANVGIVSDYIFRGISQSQHKPAIQGGFDYAHESGLYVGTWASSVNWVSATGNKNDNSLEWDIYGGYKGTFADDFSYDVGVLEYYYPGTFTHTAGLADANSTEVYASIGWKFISLKYNYTVSSHLFGWTDSTSTTKTRGSGYIDLSANYDLGEGWGMVGHVGHQDIKNFSDYSYTDWKAGVTKEVGFGVVGLTYTGTNAKYDASTPTVNYNWAGKNVGKDVVALSFTKTF